MGTMYAGVKLVSETGEKPQEGGRAERVEEDLLTSDPTEIAMSEEEEEYDSDFEDLAQEMPLDIDPDPTEPMPRLEVEGDESLPRAKNNINYLRKLLSWLAVEKGILRRKGRQPVKGKRKKRFAEIKIDLAARLLGPC